MATNGNDSRRVRNEHDRTICNYVECDILKLKYKYEKITLVR